MFISKVFLLSSAFLPGILSSNLDDDLNEDLFDIADDQVDRWEAIPLTPPSEADLIRDSDELDSMNQSEAKKMLEQEEKFLQSYGRRNKDEVELEDLEAELIDQETPGSTIKTNLQTDLPIIFNTDDFDEEFDDVPGDAPLAPPIK